ncbi:MAG: ATP-binding protein [Candidatus Staskawiczbacteria bacterium]|nr:ATP-binding protein [Candidatus Staskawiczbacteria bacterium]
MFPVNYFNIVLLVGSVIALGCGIFPYFRNTKKAVNRSWLQLNIVVAIWSIGYFTMISTSSKDIAWYSNWILHAAAILIPVMFLYFVLVLVNKVREYKILLYVSYFLTIIFEVINPTKLFIRDVKPKFIFDFVCDAGPIYFLFFLEFSVLIVIAELILYKQLKIEKDAVVAKEFKYIFLSALFGFLGGGSVFLLTFNIPFPQYPLILFAVYPIVITYAIVRYKIMDAKVVITELLTFTMWILLLVRMTLSRSLQDFLINSAVFIVIFIIGILLIRSALREAEQKEKIEKIAKELEIANEKLQELDKFKNQFFVQARHDLRAPVASIVGYSDLIMQGAFGKIPKQVKETMEKIVTLAQNMKAMAESFLDTAQFQLGKSPLQLKPDIALQAVLDEVVGEAKIKAEQNNIYLKLQKPEKDIVLTADREKLKSALSNIVGNAIKYTPQGGVSISVENNEKNVKITVADTGIGIPADKIKNIFDQKFERTSQAKKTAGGSGVGLYLAGQIIKYHQGKAWAESPARNASDSDAGGAGEGKGSIFYIELPLKMEKLNL